MTSKPPPEPEERAASSDPAPPFRYARHIFWALSAAGLTAIVIIGRAVLLPFLLAILVGYVLFPAVRLVERTKMPRWAAILLVYVVSIGAAAAFGTAVVPRLFDETKKLSAELPKLTQQIRDDFLPRLDAGLKRLTDSAELQSSPPGPRQPPPAPIVITPRDDGSFEVHLHDELRVQSRGDGNWVLTPESYEQKPAFSSQRVLSDAFDKAIAYAQKNSLELLKIGQAIVGGISRGVFYFFITLMLAGYMMGTYERIHGFVRAMWPRSRRPAFDSFLHRVDRALAGVVRGQLLICLVNGVLSAIGFWIFDLKYWPILALIAAIMSIIPIFGSILSTVPVVAIGLTQSFGTALGVLIWVIAIHQLEANFLNPKIIGDQAHIHPVLVVFALLVGEHYYQIPGALLAVPVLALVQAVFMHFRGSVLGLPPLIPLKPALARAAAAAKSAADGDDDAPSTEPMALAETERKLKRGAAGDTLKSEQE